MMKECKIITINDGNAREIANGNRLFVEEFEAMEGIISELLNDGWKVVSFAPDFNPAIQESGNYSFYKGGLTFYLEREV